MKSYTITLSLVIYVDEVEDEIEAKEDAVRQIHEMGYGELAAYMFLKQTK